MSLALYAAPFDSNILRTENSEKKRKNKTIRKERDKVNNMLDEIHSSPENDDNTLADFTPPPKPEITSNNSYIQEKKNFRSPYFFTNKIA